MDGECVQILAEHLKGLLTNKGEMVMENVEIILSDF